MGSLPPRSKLPTGLAAIGWWNRPTAYVAKLKRDLGTPFTIKLLGTGTFVIFDDPEHIKAIFTAPPDVLHPGEGAIILEPLIGRNSVILLDEDAHLSQRKLILPAFHGKRIEALRELVTEICRSRIADWPAGEPVQLHPRLQELTLEVIMEAVFGIHSQARRDELAPLLAGMLEFGQSPVSLVPQAQVAPFGKGPWARFKRVRAGVDEIVFDEIDRRRGGETEQRDDILSSLLEATHEDGSPMSRQEIRDELMTLLVAGHETTASQLSWIVDRIVDRPDILGRLREEAEAGEGSDYALACIREGMRRRPTLPFAAPRKVMQPFELAGYEFEPGVHLFASAYLVHHDPEIYPDPHAFKPERFLDQDPGTYSWIPFGGGRRRCIGASFALLEMEIVLNELVRRFELRRGSGGPELAVRRAITITPSEGGRVVLEPRANGSQAAPAAKAAAAVES